MPPLHQVLYNRVLSFLQIVTKSFFVDRFLLALNCTCPLISLSLEHLELLISLLKRNEKIGTYLEIK